jgi:sensor histidine kinase regulating citrate/malate metabolism
MNHTSTDSTDDGNDIEAIVVICVVFAIILCTIIACKKHKDKYQRDLQRHAQVFGRNPRQFTLSV